MTTQHLSIALMVLALAMSVSCVETKSTKNSKPEEKPEQDLAITLGGFIKGGPENELLDGQCTPNPNRDTLQCDIHNGLMKWRITEITFQVIRTDDREGEQHYYREQMSLAPLQTQTVTFKLGMQLPADTWLAHNTKPLSHWSWLIVGAKGQRAE